MTVRQMDEQTEEDENSPEVLDDGVISETSDVILSISHQALLLISMEELK